MALGFQVSVVVFQRVGIGIAQTLNKKPNVKRLRLKKSTLHLGNGDPVLTKNNIHWHEKHS